MIWQAEQARRVTERSGQYFDHLGFTLVALLDAFIVIAVLNLAAPIWVVVAVGILGAGLGHLTIRTLKTRLKAA